MRCYRCGKPLAADDAVWLDLNSHTNVFRRQPWPEGVSQGAWPFGQRCAARSEGQVVEEHPKSASAGAE